MSKTYVLRLFMNDKTENVSSKYLLLEKYRNYTNVKLLTDKLYEAFNKLEIEPNAIIRLYCSPNVNAMALMSLQNICYTNNNFLIVNVISGDYVSYSMSICQKTEDKNLIEKINKHIRLMGGE